MSIFWLFLGSFLLFFLGYAVFLTVIWWFYLRRRMTAWSPSLAAAQV